MVFLSRQLARVKDQLIDVYIRPNVEQFGLVDYLKMSEIAQIGGYSLPLVHLGTALMIMLYPQAIILGCMLSISGGVIKKHPDYVLPPEYRLSHECMHRIRRGLHQCGSSATQARAW